LFQEGRAFGVLRPPFQVLSAVYFYHQPSVETYKIDNVGADDVLAPEFVSLQSFCAEVIPKSPLSVSGVAAQLADPRTGLGREGWFPV